MWITDGSMPLDMVVVIIEFSGPWREQGTGNGGIRDVYAYDGEWFNIPEEVHITRWMYIPED